jgi:hypothetical protein
MVFSYVCLLYVTHLNSIIKSAFVGLCTNDRVEYNLNTAWSKISAAVKKRILSSGLLCSVRWFDIDVSELPIRPIFEGQTVQEVRPLKM